MLGNCNKNGDLPTRDYFVLLDFCQYKEMFCLWFSKCLKAHQVWSFAKNLGKLPTEKVLSTKSVTCLY